MGHERAAGRGLASLVLAVVLSLLIAVPALAWVGEGGTKNCGSYIAYVHGRYNDIADMTAPGSSITWLHRENDGLWHSHEHDGNYSGAWEVIADPSLDFANTYAGCRNYG